MVIKVSKLFPIVIRLLLVDTFINKIRNRNI